MTIWLLALVLIASLAALGFRQGGIRVAFSFVGIVLGALLAGPLGRLLRPLLVVLGVKDPVLSWVLAPFIVFLIFEVAFKLGALPVHQKADVYYKYHAGELRLALWERLNHRLGLCLGIANGVVYVLLISFIIYAASYWTVQIGTSDSEARPVRILNRLGRDLENCGFIKVAQAIDPMPQVWYDTADLAGIIYNNPLTEARVYRYPAFLGLSELPEFKDLANDKEFTEMRLQKKPAKEVFDYPKIQGIVHNPELLKQIWAILVPDLKDLNEYLVTGKSARYDSERILGRWIFDVNGAINLMRRAQPNIPSKQMQQVKRWMISAFAKTSFVAMTDHQALLKDIPQVTRPPAGAAAPPASTQTLPGQWKNVDGKYLLTLNAGGQQGDLPMTVDGDRMVIKQDGLDLAFNRED
jgi:hypothetical protein